MKNVIDVDSLKIATLNLAGIAEGNAGAPCSTCAAYRPDPLPDGNLQVDPEIRLPSPGMDVDIGYFYNSVATTNGPFGYGRTITSNLTAQASSLTGSQTLVTLTRGDGTLVSF